MRGKRAKKRPIIPDPVFKSKMVTRTINVVMERGRKSLARDIVYGAIRKLNEDEKESLKMLRYWELLFLHLFF